MYDIILSNNTYKGNGVSMRFKKLFVLVSLILCAFVLCSFEETDDFFRYEINEKGEAEITAYVGEKFSTNVTVPDNIEGHSVTVIRESAFYNHPYIEKLYIPSSVKIIEGSAFAYCSSLESVTFEDSDQELFISEYAFEMCVSLKSVEFSNRVTYIDNYAFLDCLMLGKVYFPESIKEIGYQAFRGCESIIFDCDDCPVARDYAEENNVPVNFRQSDDFLILVVFLAAIVIFILICIVKNQIDKRKNKKNKNNF